MSREINNSEYRQKVIRDLLAQLHEGKPTEEVKAQFKSAFSGVSAQEIAQAENELIAGGLPPEEIRKLCDIHASIFEGSIEEIHRPQDQDPAQIPGHPAHTLRAENAALTHLIEDSIRLRLKDYQNKPDKDTLKALAEAFAPLQQVNIHYIRKENLLFPYMELHGITAPPKVMWGVDDDIRGLIKHAGRLLHSVEDSSQDIAAAVDASLTKTAEMVFKEENILLPMLLETLTSDEWQKIAAESDELGYCLISPPPKWRPGKVFDNGLPAEDKEDVPTARIILPTGRFNPEDLAVMLNTLPIDITFVDKNDTVQYFSQGTERIFPRTKAIIGRKVANCHPPASVHIVEKILDDFRTGKKDHEDFWLSIHGKFILIRYYAMRDPEGEYLGTLEVTQDIAPIQQITGEKRLVSE